MSLIYETAGRAREYNALAVNVYNGCAHGCRYCYAPRITHQTPVEFHKPKTRGVGFVARVENDARKLQARGEKRPILLSFLTDPYQPIEADMRVTRETIRVLHACGLKVAILTKGGRLARRDIDLLGPGDEFATTLTCWTPQSSHVWEPEAAPPQERIDNLAFFRAHGIKTWVSLEPILNRTATCQLIAASWPHVDEYRVGTLNYIQGRETDWRQVGIEVISLLRRVGARYMVKADLRQYLGSEWDYEGGK